MRREEAKALHCVKQFFREHVDPQARCLPGDDPPDLVCETAACRVAVEVTFVGQRETLDGETVAQFERDAPLMRMGCQLGEATKDVRRRDCQLFLSGPPQGKRFRRWKSAVYKTVRSFIESGERGQREFEGGLINAYKPGDRWQVGILPREGGATPSGALSADIEANIEDMLLHALSAKASKLAPLQGYRLKAILLLNTYPFGDHVNDVRRAIVRLMGNNPNFAVFDIIFYVTEDRLWLLHGEERLLSSTSGGVQSL